MEICGSWIGQQPASTAQTPNTRLCSSRDKRRKPRARHFDDVSREGKPRRRDDYMRPSVFTDFPSPLGKTRGDGLCLRKPTVRGRHPGVCRRLPVRWDDVSIKQ